MDKYPISSIFGKINTKRDCPFYFVKAGACKDGLYKNCSPKRCNRINGKKKARGYGDKKYGTM